MDIRSDALFETDMCENDVGGDEDGVAGSSEQGLKDRKTEFADGGVCGVPYL
jgi:hypothetical protein